MNITIVTDILGLENNGTVKTIRRLIDGLAAKGHQVRVVSPLHHDDSANPKYYATAKRHFGIFDKYISKTNGADFGLPDKHILRTAIEGADVVHICLPFRMGRAAAEICKELDVPFTSAFHCQPENVTSHIFLKNSRLANRCLYLRFRRFYKKVGYIHCPSQFIADELTKNGYKAKKFVISNGVVRSFHKQQVDKPAQLQDKFVILFTGRYSKEKRHDLLINAVKHSKYNEKIQLIFAGNGPNEKNIRRCAKGLANAPIMQLMPQEELAKVVNFSDLYVHPSDVEIEAIACLEAMACGVVPVINNSCKSATKAFALDERSLFAQSDYKDLTQKIEYWIEHPQQKAEMSARYEQYAKSFDIDVCIDKMVDMFEEAIADHKAATAAGNDNQQ